MAEGALFDLAGKVINALGSLIVQEVKLASSVETEIEYLTNTVSTIQAVILDAEKQSSHSHQIKAGSVSSKMSSMMLMTCWMISPPKYCTTK